MTVLITGAAAGLGQATARRFLEGGATVYALDRVPADDLAGAIPLVADVTDTETLERLAQELATAGVELDAVMSFAGIHRMENFLEVADRDLEQVFDVNVLGPIRVNRAFFPLLKQGGTLLVTTSEVAPLDPLPFNGLYSVSKCALDAYTQALRQEAGLLGAQVVTLRPGSFSTALSASSIPSMEKMAEKSRYYGGNAPRFAALMTRFAGRFAHPDRLAERVWRLMRRRRKRCVVTVHPNLLLRLLALLPKRMQCRIVAALIRTKSPKNP